MALSLRRQKFVNAYLIDPNATAAAKAAGYSEKTARQQGQRLLTNVSVTQAIAESQERVAKSAEISAEYILGRIRETLERCSQHQPVLDRDGKQVMVTTPDGDMVPSYAFDAQGVLKASELLGKHIGLFPNKTQWNGTLEVKNHDAVPRPSTYAEWLAYQQQLAAQAAQPPVIALPPPQKVNGH